MRAWHARHAVDKRPDWDNPPTPGYVAFLLWGGEPGRVGLVVEAAANDRTAHRNLTGGVHVDGKTESVEELRTQFSLFGVHGANQDEPRLM